MSNNDPGILEEVNIDNFLDIETQNSSNSSSNQDLNKTSLLSLMEEIDLSDYFDPGDDNSFVPKREAEVSLKNSGEDLFQKRIESYYLHKQLADALIIKGEIPMNPLETKVGIGFIDIANYSYLSKWLSPKENQLLLNGLYSAFTHVIKKRGGFLNKIDGDSLMFHFGGVIDSNVSELSENETQQYIASNLFQTCVELQRACHLFNNANKLFLDENTHPETKESVEHAFFIISSLRSNLALASGVDAMFQIMVRIGASIGEVSIGNFGPEGKKQWDVIGEPVIEAKRMESTAPIGGLRISESLYNALEHDKAIEKYYQDFKEKAKKNNWDYQDILLSELFSYKKVLLKQKNNACFRTYSVQVTSNLPEQISRQVCSFIFLGEDGSDKIIDMIKYNRGNRLVMKAIEKAFIKNNIEINKIELLKILSPKKYEKMKSKIEEENTENLQEQYSLFNIFQILGSYQDRITLFSKSASIKLQDINNTHESSIQQKKAELLKEFEIHKKKIIYKTYFKEVVFPLIFRSIKNDILAYQNSTTPDKRETVGCTNTIT